mmetsp:Transcript_5308/g.15424  ORF Transcript_5308/g.15424 Transcript_5308/m.15424 type:complete len:239 (+) Transcript_5308:500-1216(+)
MLFFFLVTFLAPGGNRFTMENDDLEEGVQKQNSVRSNAVGIQQDRCRWAVETVREKSWLNHDQRVRRILLDQVVTMPGSFIGTGVEHIQELRSSKMEHELRIHAEFRCQVETGRIVRSVLGKFGTQPNQGPIHPSKNIGKLIRVRLVNGQSSRQDRRCLLIKGGTNRRILRIKVGRSSIFGSGWVVPSSTKRGGPKPCLPGGCLVLRQELGVSTLGFRKGIVAIVGHVEVNGDGGFRS